MHVSLTPWAPACRGRLRPHRRSSSLGTSLSQSTKAAPYAHARDAGAPHRRNSKCDLCEDGASGCQLGADARDCKGARGARIVLGAHDQWGTLPPITGGLPFPDRTMALSVSVMIVQGTYMLLDPMTFKLLLLLAASRLISLRRSDNGIPPCSGARKGRHAHCKYSVAGKVYASDHSLSARGYGKIGAGAQRTRCVPITAIPSGIPLSARS